MSGKMSPEKKAPRKKAPEKIGPRKITTSDIVPPPEHCQPEKCPRENCTLKNCFSIFLLFLTLSYGCSFKNFLQQLVSEVVGVVDLSLSLLSEAFQRYLSVSHIAQLVTHGKGVKIVKPVLCKITAHIFHLITRLFKALHF